MVFDRTRWIINAAGNLTPRGDRPVSIESLAYAQGLETEEDDNSPLVISNATSGTINLAGQYKGVWVIIVDGSNNVKPNLRVNQDSGANYDYTNPDGTNTTGANEFGEVLNAGRSVGQVIHLSGEWDQDLGFGTAPLGFDASRAIQGRNTNVTSPLTHIEFFASSSFSLTARVIGVMPQ